MSSSQNSQSQHQTKPAQVILPAKEGRGRIRSQLSVLDDNVQGERRSKSSTSSQGHLEFGKIQGPNVSKTEEVQKPESNARKSTRVFRNSRTKEDQTPATRKAVTSSSLQVSGPSGDQKARSPDATFVILQESLELAANLDSHSETRGTVKEEELVLPKDVLNINIAEGLYEYSQEVHNYLLKMEKVSTIPRNFLDNDEVTDHMRAVLVDWLTQVQHHLKVSVETLYRTVSTLDLVLSLRAVDPHQLQLVGITSMLLASKLEEYYPVEISKLLHLTENSYNKEELLQMERIILQLLGFQFRMPSAQSFLPLFSRAALREGEEEFYSSCTFLLDCHLLLPSHSSLPPSHRAASAVLAALTLYRATVETSLASPELRRDSIWSCTLVHYTGYSVGDIRTSAGEMLEQLRCQGSDGGEFTGALTKYRSRSQHNQLALAAHMKLKNILRAKKILEAVETK